MAVKFDVDAELTKLEQVSEQIASAKERDQGKVAMARIIGRAGDYIMAPVDDKVEGSPTRKSIILELTDITEADLDHLVETLWSLGTQIAPEAQQTWSKEQVLESLTKLDAMAVLDLLDEEQAVRAATVKQGLDGLRKGGGTGQRAARRSLPPVEGRPYERVRIVKVDDNEVIANQSANKENSVSNVKTAIVKYLKNASVNITADLDKSIGAAVKSVVEDGATEAVIEGALRIEPVASSGNEVDDDEGDEGTEAE